MNTAFKANQAKTKELPGKTTKSAPAGLSSGGSLTSGVEPPLTLARVQAEIEAAIKVHALEAERESETQATLKSEIGFG